MTASALVRRTALAATTAGAVVLAGLVTAPPGLAAGGTFVQPTVTTIPDSGQASPYPSSINVTGLPSGVTDVNVTLTGLDHTYPDDLDILLVGPKGQAVTLTSDAGNGFGVIGVNLTLDDQAASALPDETQIVSGTFKPTDYVEAAEPADPYNPPAPATGPASSTLANFNGTDPNGVWNLFVMDDAGGDQGTFSSWSLQITTVDVPAAPVFTTPASNPSTDNDGDFILAGTAQSGSTVKVFEGATQVGTATAGGGSWAVALVDVAHGTHSYTATATDTFGNVSAASAARTVRIDTVHPHVTRTRPAAGADEVRRGRNIRARFSEAVRPGTLTATNVRLVNTETGKAVRARRTYDASSRSVIVNPRRDLAADTRYRVVIGTGVKDVAGNRLDQKPRPGNQPKVWRFTTR
jgi:subtilisin-like proprotein convertase family protein